MKKTLIFFAFLPLVAYDEIHRYRPILFFGEPHLARSGLMDFKLQADHGSAKHAFNSCGAEVYPADIFGTPYQQAIRSNGALPAPNIATNFQQKLTFTELIITWYQNFAGGFFITGYVPFRTIHVHNFPQITPYNPLQQQQRIYRGMGDFACSLGWAWNYEETVHVDFVDASVQLGVAFPTSNPRLSNDLFGISLGYDGQIGYFLVIDSSVGIFDWLTFGFHTQGLFFGQQAYGRQVLIQQPESLRTLQGCVDTKKSPAWVAGIYTKADHMFVGFSATLGYSFIRQEIDRIRSTCNIIFPSSRLQMWNMHIINFLLDYDFATYSNPYAPDVSVAYNKILAGKNVYDTSLWGGALELTLLFKF
jgi:hypothetical protein